MSVQLLDKTRKINKLLHNNNSHKVVFNDICEVLTEILNSNILVISKKGKVLGVGLTPDIVEIQELIADQVGGYVDTMLNERLLSILSTKENVNLETLGFTSDNIRKYQAIITPIDIAGERLGTLFIYKSDDQYDIDDIILSEYGTTVVGLEMMRSVNEENAEETRKVQIVK
jgi:transcriptional pleiotropic repressor